MKLLITSLTIFIISGCCSTPSIPAHPALNLPVTPALPKFTREMLDCGSHNPDTLPLCRKIKEREVVLHDHIETIETIVDTHNNELN